jgi:hypothetical protein
MGGNTSRDPKSGYRNFEGTVSLEDFQRTMFNILKKVHMLIFS